MGTMGPVSEEPGLSLWDAMSVLCPAPARRGGTAGGVWGHSGRGGGHTHHSIGNPLQSEERKRREDENNRHMKPRGGRRERAAGGRGPGPHGAPGPGAPRTALPGAAIPNPPKLQLDGSARGPATRAAPVGRPLPQTRACQGGGAGAGAEPGGRG